MRNNGYILTSIILVSILLFAFVAPQFIDRGIDAANHKLSLHIPHIKNFLPFRLGLDLLGGTHLVYQADLSTAQGNTADAMAGIRDVIERRVNIFGVAEPIVQVSGKDRLIVELAGVKDVNQAIQLIGATPFLEFKEETPDTQAILQAQQQGQRLNEEPFKQTGLNGKDLTRATVIFDPQTYRPEVSLEFNDAGKKLFADITTRDVGKRIAVYLDGYPISIATVQTPITTGNAVISGNFTPDDAKLLATRLNSGALPVPIKLVSQQTVGASLGAESLSKSLKAGLYGFLFVALFMILFYRLPGVMAVLALGVYTLIVLAVYKLIPVTLSLSGIAGFVLSLGIAVDANVLIFARLREELGAGRSLQQAEHEGFRRAWLAIRDSHVTTLIGAFALYALTTSIVKGFALTLGIGVLTSLLTATIVTRSFLWLFTGQAFQKRLWLFR